MIKRRSTSHYLLLMLASARSAPKPKVLLVAMSNKEPYRVQRSLDVLAKQGLVHYADDKYTITSEGKDLLVSMSS